MIHSTERMEIYRQIRIALVRHFIDIGRLSCQISSLGVRLHGSLARLPGVQAMLTPEVVASIINEIARIQGVRRVDCDFDNWRQSDPMGGWQPVEKLERHPYLADQLGGVHEIPGEPPAPPADPK